MEPVSPRSPKLLDQLRLKLRANHYSYRTEQVYVRWVERFLRYHRDQNRGVWKHPQTMGKAEVKEYLTSPRGESKRGAFHAKSSFLSTSVFLGTRLGAKTAGDSGRASAGQATYSCRTNGSGSD